MANYIIPDDFLSRGDFKQEDLVVHAIDLTTCRVHDAMQTNLPGTAAADDMALISGTPGTSPPTLQGVDFGATSTDEKCAFVFPLPIEYADAESVVLRCHAGMLTTVSDGTATLDVECWSDDGDGTVSADLCTTAAQSINSLTLADKDFTITGTALTTGELLQFRLTFGGSDTGDAGVMIPTITKISVLLDCRA